MTDAQSIITLFIILLLIVTCFWVYAWFRVKRLRTINKTILIHRRKDLNTDDTVENSLSEKTPLPISQIIDIEYDEAGKRHVFKRVEILSRGSSFFYGYCQITQQNKTFHFQNIKKAKDTHTGKNINIPQDIHCKPTIITKL